MTLHNVTTGSVQRCLQIGKRQDWDQISIMCREELQRRAYQDTQSRFGP